MGKLSISFVALIFIFVFQEKANAAFFITADTDLRYTTKENKLKIEGSGVSLRKIISDRKGDRIILFTLLDAMDNFEKIMFDQSYIQYKGPLGRWNVTAGRFRLPFGLLPNYSTKRLLIKTLEYKTIGLAEDTGLLFSGVLRDFDYGVSISHGEGHGRWTDRDTDKLLTFRIGYQGVDFEDLRIGLSGLSGRVMQKHTRDILYKELLAVDVIKYYGQIAMRGELSLGRQEQKNLIGFFSGIDYTIFPRVELNTGYTYSHKGHHSNLNALNVGLSYYGLPFGIQIRLAQKISFLREDKDEFSSQVYSTFSYSF